jgi:hypothetical protein
VQQAAARLRAAERAVSRVLALRGCS